MIRTALLAIVISALAFFGNAATAQADTIRPVPVTPVVMTDPGQLVGAGLYGAGVGAVFGAAIGAIGAAVIVCLPLVTCVLAPPAALVGAVAGGGIGAVAGAALAVHEAQTYQP